MNKPESSAAHRRPDLGDKDKGVHIIFVPTDLVLNAPRARAAGHGPADTITLAEVTKHIGAPAPTDVIVFNGEPYHFAGRPPGQPMELRAHPQVHRDFPETILVIRPDEHAVWWSETPFQITDVAPSADPLNPNPLYPEGSNPAPTYPFIGPQPPPTRIETDSFGDLSVARADIPKVEAHKHMYKISFSMQGVSIDPDGYCSGGSN